MNTLPGSTNARQRNATSIQKNAVCARRPTTYRTMRAAEKWQFGQTSTRTDVNQQCDIVRQRYNCRQIGGMTMRRNGELRRIVALASALGKVCARPRFATVRLRLTMRSPRCVQLLTNPSFERRGSHASLPERRRQKRRDSFNRRPGREFRLQICLFS